VDRKLANGKIVRETGPEVLSETAHRKRIRIDVLEKRLLGDEKTIRVTRLESGVARKYVKKWILDGRTVIRRETNSEIRNPSADLDASNEASTSVDPIPGLAGHGEIVPIWGANPRD